eukprot:723664-Pyramimonas_sp.AAC.1
MKMIGGKWSMSAGTSALGRVHSMAQDNGVGSGKGVASQRRSIGVPLECAALHVSQRRTAGCLLKRVEARARAFSRVVGIVFTR